MSSFPEWMSSNPIVDPDVSHKCHQMINEVVKEKKIDLVEITPYDWFLTIINTVFGSNMLNIGDRIGPTGYPDFLTHDEVSKSVMWGYTTSSNIFVVIKFDIEGETVMTTFYERRASVWISCGQGGNLFCHDGALGDDQFEFLANILAGRSIVAEPKHHIQEKYMGKGFKFLQASDDSEPEPAPEEAANLFEMEVLPDGRRIPKAGEIITFRAGYEFPNGDSPVGRTISTYRSVPIEPTDAVRWRVTEVDPHGNCMNVKGSRVDNSNVEPHDVPQVYIHVEPVALSGYKARMMEADPSADIQCFWWIDFTNGYIRQWEDSTITHSFHDLKVVDAADVPIAE